MQHALPLYERGMEQYRKAAHLGEDHKPNNIFPKNGQSGELVVAPFLNDWGAASCCGIGCTKWSCICHELNATRNSAAVPFYLVGLMTRNWDFHRECRNLKYIKSIVNKLSEAGTGLQCCQYPATLEKLGT